LSNCNLDKDLHEQVNNYIILDRNLTILCIVVSNIYLIVYLNQILQFILQIKQREIKFGTGLFFGYNFIRQVCMYIS